MIFDGGQMRPDDEEPFLCGGRQLARRVDEREMRGGEQLARFIVQRLPDGARLPLEDGVEPTHAALVAAGLRPERSDRMTAVAAARCLVERRRPSQMDRTIVAMSTRTRRLHGLHVSDLTARTSVASPLQRWLARKQVCEGVPDGTDLDHTFRIRGSPALAGIRAGFRLRCSSAQQRGAATWLMEDKRRVCLSMCHQRQTPSSTRLELGSKKLLWRNGDILSWAVAWCLSK
jgi:hypothetical protein